MPFCLATVVLGAASLVDLAGNLLGVLLERTTPR